MSKSRYCVTIFNWEVFLVKHNPLECIFGEFGVIFLFKMIHHPMKLEIRGKALLLPIKSRKAAIYYLFIIIFSQSHSIRKG